MCSFPAQRCAADRLEMQRAAGLRPGACLLKAAICLVQWLRAVGHCDGTCSGGGIAAGNFFTAKGVVKCRNRPGRGSLREHRLAKQ